MRYIIFLFLFLLGCPLAGIRGEYTTAQDQYTLTTQAKCFRPADAVKVADTAIPITLEILKEYNYIQDIDKFKDSLKKETLICLIPEPEPCCIFSGRKCAGPANSDGTLYAHKAGCATEYTAWASITWPFECSSNWPDEPHCTKDKSTITSKDWVESLRHEIFNMIIARLYPNMLPEYAPDGTPIKGYTAYVYKVIEPIVRDRFNKAYY